MPKYRIPKNIIGPQLRAVRDKHRWSQQKFASKCQLAGWDISRSIVAAIEGRVRWVGDFEIVLLAHVLQVSTGSLLPARVDWNHVRQRLKSDDGPQSLPRKRSKR